MKQPNILSSVVGIVLGVLATISLKPTSTLAFLFIATWVAAPFIGALILSVMAKKKLSLGVNISLAVGVIAFVDIRFLHPDPQGGIAFMMLPLIFWAIIGGSMAITDAAKKKP